MMSITKKLAILFRFRIWAKLRQGNHASFYLSHSQFGEDMVLRALLADRASGTYVDIGAHHPVYFSNTYYFYCQGWRGLNIDAQPGSMDAFKVLRPGDMNVEAGVGPRGSERLCFYQFDVPALNTFDSAAAEEHLRSGRARLLAKTDISVRTITDLVDEYLPNKKIDLLSVDVEGIDELILRSNDWSRCRPKVVVFERHGVAVGALATDPLVIYMQETGYRLEAKCGPSIIMTDSRQMASLD